MSPYILITGRTCEVRLRIPNLEMVPDESRDRDVKAVKISG